MKPPSASFPATHPLLNGFDEERGLWRIDGPGHTRPVAGLKAVRSGVLSAGRLMVAAQLGALDALPVERVLRALRELQCTDGSHLHGCFKWYAEEPSPVDTNAAFFTGLNLILLAIRHTDDLPGGAKDTLDAILEDLFVWFERESTTGLAYYPNKFLGDLVCVWLLHERLDLTSKTEELAAILDQSADYWLQQHWGWGEHLSEVYAIIMLNELSALLLFARRLPPVLRKKYHGLFRELMDIEDAFAGGPRVPAIRTYDFGWHPKPRLFRATVVSWAGRTTAPDNAGEHFSLGHVFHEKGWRKLAGPPRPSAGRVKIDCFGGAKATAWITPTARLGTLSRFPLMPNTDHETWGLSWQTMPVVFAAGGEGWGFLRWHTRENGVDRFHPARDKHAAYLNNALTDTVAPPIVGRTDALQEGGHACVLRRMPALSRSWELLADQLVLTGSVFSVVAEETGVEVSRLLLKVGNVPFTVAFFSFGSGVRPRLWREGGEVIWEAAWPAETLKGQERTAGAWMIAWGRDVPCPQPPSPAPPAKEGQRIRLRNDKSWILNWPIADGSATVAVDPLDEQPLRRVD